MRLSSTGAFLQHASHLLPLLESSSQVSWLQLPLTVLPAGLPMEDSGDALGHAGPHDLASLFLLLPAGDLRATGLLPVSRTYLGLSHGHAVGVQGMVGNTSSFLRRQQNQPAVVMATVEERPCIVVLCQALPSFRRRIHGHRIANHFHYRLA